MSLSSPIADPGFFGKDDFVPFIGQVVNVDDPKRSGRVKVRCVGWHPKDVKDLPNEDLPWARVGMPTTHAQIGRVGGKHGLLAGSWVMGFFLDGHNAQDPFVLTSFNNTSNSTEKPNRQVPKGSGKLSPEDGAFNKKTQPGGVTNPGQQLKDELGSNRGGGEADKSADNATHNAKSLCGDGQANQSIADDNARNKPNTADNQTSMNYNVGVADPKCGASAHAGERIQIVLQEYFPNDDVRFAFNDVVYSAITGNRIDLDIILNLAAILICDILKDSIENLRGLVNDTLFRPSRSVAILAATTREPSTVKAADQTSKALIDVSNKVFTEAINALCEIIRDLLKTLNDGSKDESTDSSLSASPVSPIGNIGAQCVTDLILQNVLTLISASIANELGVALTNGQVIAGSVNDLITNIQDGDEDGILENISDILGSLGIASEFVDQAGNFLDFIQSFKFTLNPVLFNTLGLFVLDIFNLDGCVKEGLISTSEGLIGSISGGGGVGSTLEDFLPGSDFGGLPPGSNTGTYSTTLCDESLGTKIPGVDFPSTSCKADVITVSVPSSEQNAAQNYISGIANSVVIRDPGCEFFFGRGDQILFDIGNLFPPDDVL